MYGYLAVAAGGLAGTIARYSLDKAMAGIGFPCSTLLVNVAGSLGLALFLFFCSSVRQRSYSLFLLITTGFFGSFTTFSAFSMQVLQMIASGRTGEAALYALSSVILGLLAIWAAMRIYALRMQAGRGESCD